MTKKQLIENKIRKIVREEIEKLTEASGDRLMLYIDRSNQANKFLGVLDDYDDSIEFDFDDMDNQFDFYNPKKHGGLDKLEGVIEKLLKKSRIKDYEIERM